MGGKKELSSSCKVFWLESSLSHAELSLEVRMDLASKTGMTELEELCSPASPQGTRYRRECNKLCRLAFPKPWDVWTRALAFSISLYFFFSFFPSFLYFFFFFRAYGQIKKPVLTSCLWLCVTNPSLMILLGTTSPKPYTTLMLSFCPARWTQLIFTFNFPAWKGSSTKKGKRGFFPFPPRFNVRSGQSLWRDQSRTTAKLQL